jgi:hypothetical protein
MEQIEMKFKLFLDYDCSDWLFKSLNPIWDEGLEIVKIMVKRLKDLGLGKAIIKKSSDRGRYHVKFPDTPLTLEELHALMLYAKCPREYMYWLVKEEGATLRISEKKNEIEPYVIEVCI